MPKPFPSTITVLPNGMAALKRPELGAWIACIASLSGMLERSIAGILGDIMETHSKQALAMYLALSGSQARKSALLAAARLHISEDEYAELVKVYKKVGETAGERNDVIHGAWAIHDSCPNALLLCNPNAYVLFESAAHELTKVVTVFPENEETMALFRKRLLEVNFPSYLIYETDDFYAIAKKLGDLIRKVETFREQLREKYRWQLPAPEPHLTGNQQTKP
jgi:hypothetical protein